MTTLKKLKRMAISQWNVWLRVVLFCTIFEFLECSYHLRLDSAAGYNRCIPLNGEGKKIKIQLKPHLAAITVMPGQVPYKAGNFQF